MDETALNNAIQSIPPGPWALGVSGGADSMALLGLIRTRADIQPHVVHLDHGLRGKESSEDAAFVRGVCRAWNLPATIATRAEIAATSRYSNPSEKYRHLRLQLFAGAARTHNLQGVLLAHHRDDQAETVFQRLLRGGGYRGLCGMRHRAVVAGLHIQRPLLDMPRAWLREFLIAASISWREDSSNAGDAYSRNRVRKLLAGRAGLFDQLIELARSCAALRDWVDVNAPRLDIHFETKRLNDLPRVLADEAARRWLVQRGVSAVRVDAAAVKSLLTMAADAAAPARISFPSGLSVRRTRKVIAADQS